MQHQIFTRSKPALARPFGVACALLASLCLAACGGSTEGSSNLGDTAEEPEPEEGIDFVPGVSAFSGVWLGHAEAPLDFDENGAPGTYAFPSGSTEFRLEFRLPRSANLGLPPAAAKLTFGQSPAPAITSFDVGYPPGVDYLTPGLWGAPALPPIEGVEHQLLALRNTGLVPAEELRTMDDEVMRFFFYPMEGYGEWCGGQVPYGEEPYSRCLEARGGGATRGPDGYECNVSTSSADDVPVDCGKYYLCMGKTSPVCHCNGTECFFDSDVTASLFVRRIGNELLGSFSGAVFFDDEGLLTTLGTVRFQRVSD
jgi:hypothetical protein